MTQISRCFRKPFTIATYYADSKDHLSLFIRVSKCTVRRT